MRSGRIERVLYAAVAVLAVGVVAACGDALVAPDAAVVEFDPMLAKGGPARVTICHFPPDDPDNPRVLSLPEKAAAAHTRDHDGDGVVGEDYDENCEPLGIVITFESGKPVKDRYFESGMEFRPDLGSGGLRLLDRGDGDIALYGNSGKSAKVPARITIRRDDGSPFTLLSVQTYFSSQPHRYGTHELTSDKGGIATLTGGQVNTFSGAEWTDVTHVTWTIRCTDFPCPNDGYLDNVTVRY